MTTPASSIAASAVDLVNIATSDNSKLSKLYKGFTIGKALYAEFKEYQRRRKNDQAYTLRIGSSDSLHPIVSAWLLEQVPPSNQRCLSVSTRVPQSAMSSFDIDDDEQVESTPVSPLAYSYEGGGVLNITVDGHLIDVYVDNGEAKDDDEDGFKVTERRLAFVAYSEAGIEALKQKLEELAKEQINPSLCHVFIGAPWGGWNRTASITGRDPKTVVLADGQMDRVIGDLDQFLKSEALYQKIGIPWHRGYLFHGPPGTGKTSLAMALAKRFSMNIYYIPLSDVQSDAKLGQLINGVRDRSILLLEDIDVTHAAKSREDSERLSAQGLLNALDGVITSHGLITIMTTNNIEILDEALLRSGRCDVQEEVGYLNDAQMETLVTNMTGVSGSLPPIGSRQIAPATIVGIVKKNITDLTVAHDEIVAFLRGDDLERLYLSVPTGPVRLVDLP